MLRRYAARTAAHLEPPQGVIPVERQAEAHLMPLRSRFPALDDSPLRPDVDRVPRLMRRVPQIEIVVVHRLGPQLSIVNMQRFTLSRAPAFMGKR